MTQTIGLIVLAALLLWGVIALFKYEGKKLAAKSPEETKKHRKEWAIAIMVIFAVVQWAKSHESANSQATQITHQSNH